MPQHGHIGQPLTQDGLDTSTPAGPGGVPVRADEIYDRAVNEVLQQQAVGKDNINMRDSYGIEGRTAHDIKSLTEENQSYLDSAKRDLLQRRFPNNYNEAGLPTNRIERQNPL